jgi:hypothetical protein
MSVVFAAHVPVPAGRRRSPPAKRDPTDGSCPIPALRTGRRCRRDPATWAASRVVDGHFGKRGCNAEGRGRVAGRASAPCTRSAWCLARPRFHTSCAPRCLAIAGTGGQVAPAAFRPGIERQVPQGSRFAHVDVREASPYVAGDAHALIPCAMSVRPYVPTWRNERRSCRSPGRTSRATEDLGRQARSDRRFVPDACGRTGRRCPRSPDRGLRAG